MTQPITHPAAIPALVGVSIGLTAGVAGEIARNAGISDASILQVKTGAAAATVFACSQTPTTAAGALGGFLAGETAARVPTAFIFNSGTTVCQAAKRGITSIWNRVKAGAAQVKTNLSDRIQPYKEDAEIGLMMAKALGAALIDEAKERGAAIANKPVCQKAIQFSKTTPGKALGAVVGAYAAYAALPFWAIAAGVPVAAMAHERYNRPPPPPPSPDDTY